MFYFSNMAKNLTQKPFFFSLPSYHNLEQNPPRGTFLPVCVSGAPLLGILRRPDGVLRLSDGLSISWEVIGLSYNNFSLSK